jgi:hypothetical protein
VYLLNQASQLFRRLVSTANDYDDTSSNDIDDYSSNQGDTIIIDTRNQPLNILLEDNRENHSDSEGDAAQRGSHDRIEGIPTISEPPEHQEPQLPSSSELTSTIQKALVPPGIVRVRGKLIPLRDKSTRITDRNHDHRALLTINQNTEASKIPSLIKEALTGPDAYL